ncbi:MAG: ribonuclease HII, partial [Thermoanaerobaculia bacterium]|nr:ribonuclease HII [Thermoanaerobaculia bacterium]
MAGLFAIEDEARAEGHALIAGVDEVGRGCVAGPVYAGAVVFEGPSRLPGLDDSKALPPEVREALAVRIRGAALGAAVGAASAAEIDAIGIVAATFLAMRRA